MYSPVRVSTLMSSPVHEQRDLHDETGLQRRGLARARHTIALDARFGLGDRQLDRRREFHPMISSSWRMSMALPVSLRKLAASPRLLDDTGTWS